MTDHKPIPVEGYKPQSQFTIDVVNANKRLEEQCLRVLDSLALNADVDQRWLARGRTQLEESWMAINRAIFKPGRVKLDGDAA